MPWAGTQGIYFEVFGRPAKWCSTNCNRRRKAVSFLSSILILISSPHHSLSLSTSFPSLFFFFTRLLSSTFLKMGCVQSSAVDEEAKARSCSPSFLTLRSAAYASSPLPLPQEMKKLRASSGGIRSWRRTKLRCCCSAQASRARCDPFIPTCLHRTIHDKIIPPSHHPSPRYSSR